MDQRVALTPADVGALVRAGATVYVERGAGEGVGFADAEYVEQGAQLQSAGDIYRDKDLVLGVTEERINLLREFDAEEDDQATPEPKSFASLLKRKTDDEG